MSASIYFRHGCIVYVGTLPDLPNHAHIAPAVCAGLDGPLEIRGRGLEAWTECRAAYIPSNAMHEIHTRGGRFATILPEPGNAACEVIKPRGVPHVPDEELPIMLEPEYGQRIPEAVRRLEDAREHADIEAALDELLTREDYTVSPMAADPRLLRVMEIIVAAPNESVDADELAAAIGMSRSWLLHAFKTRVGVSLRRFRAWFRLKAAALLMHRGESPAQAALGAGFYDQSHYANAFREMLGIQPGLVFRERETIRWHIEDAPLLDHLLHRVSGVR